MYPKVTSARSRLVIGAVQRMLVRFVGLEMPLKSASALTRPKPVPTTWSKLLRCPWYEPLNWLRGVICHVRRNCC